MMVNLIMTINKSVKWLYAANPSPWNCLIKSPLSGSDDLLFYPVRLSVLHKLCPIL